MAHPGPVEREVYGIYFLVVAGDPFPLLLFFGAVFFGAVFVVSVFFLVSTISCFNSS